MSACSPDYYGVFFRFNGAAGLVIFSRLGKKHLSEMKLGERVNYENLVREGGGSIEKLGEGGGGGGRYADGGK